MHMYILYTHIIWGALMYNQSLLDLRPGEAGAAPKMTLKV